MRASLLGRATAVFTITTLQLGCPIPDDFPYPDDAEAGADSASETGNPDTAAPDSGARDSTLADVGDAAEVGDTADAARMDAADSTLADSSAVDTNDASISDSDSGDVLGVDTDRCPRGAIYCAGSALRQCAADGSSWTTLETCATPELCTAGLPTACATPTCSVGEKKCVGTDLQICDAGRTAFTTERTCAIGCKSAACLDVLSIESGATHSCALLSDESIRCWGAGGLVGDGTFTMRTTPVDAGGTVAKTALAVSTDDVFFIAKDGTLRGWGTDVDYELLNGGEGSVTPTAVRVGAFSGVVAVGGGGETHACAALVDGTTRCWGTNDNGQLGDGTTTSATVSPVTVASATAFIALTAGLGHTCGITNTKNLTCWGANSSGALGDGTVGNRTTPGPGILGGVIEVSAGYLHTCAIAADYSVRCWGDNSFGQLGDGTTIQRGAPTVVAGLRATHIAAGQYHTCAILTDGSVKCWGKNIEGQLGDGTTTSRSSPTLVTGVTGATSIGAGYYQTCVGVPGAGAYCWGDNSHGQLGDGTTTNRSTPTAVKW